MNPIDTLIKNYPMLESCLPEIQRAANALIECYRKGGTVYTCGNGGSAADADHITGEFLKGFCKKRPMTEEQRRKLSSVASSEDSALLGEKLQRGLRAVPLMNLTAAYTATGNDLGGDLSPAQILFALARTGDVLIGLSTSGNSTNVRYAVDIAKMQGVVTIGMTGSKGGWLGTNADITIKVPADETFRIQELHLPIYHTLCLLVENAFFDR